jgi:Alkaline phosphatase PhoX
MVGLPDGLGAAKSPNGRDFTLFMNHELRVTQGVPRRHGVKGAFVSELQIDKITHEVEQGGDLIDPGVRYWNYVTQSYGPTPSPAGDNPRKTEDPVDPAKDDFVAQLAEFGRFCSSSITELGQLFNPRTGNGYRGQVYFANEETDDEGRVFGITTDGQAQQLPRLGLFQWENALAAFNETDTTVTMGQEDSALGQPWIHVGRKQDSGTPFDRAGLTNGTNFVLDLVDEAVDSDAEFRATYGKGTPAEFSLGEDEAVDWDQSGKQQNLDAIQKGITLNRIEDGAWDPRHPDDFYFVTTEGAPGTVPGTDPPISRDGGGVWRIRFDDVERPELGGTLELLLDGSEAPFLNKPDNVGMDRHGHLLIQEDPGNNAQLARIIAYDVESGERGVLAQFDPALFTDGEPGFLTQDEESSGIVDASKLLGERTFLFDAQVHIAHPDVDKVEYGQLMTLEVRRWKDVLTIPAQ